MPTPRSLVVDDGGAATGVAAVRGLSRAGFEVTLVGPGGLAGASRHVARHLPAPAARDDADGLMATVERAAHEADVIVPTGDAELLALAEAANGLAAPVLAPDADVVRTVSDKAWLAATAARHGLATPGTWAAGDLPAAALPPAAAVVVKPRSHGLDTEPRSATRSTWAAVLDVAPPAGSLVQEAVDGPLGALVVALAPDGTLLGSVQQVADVVHPAGAGNTVRGRTVPTDPDLLESLLGLLRTVGWFGPMQAETVGGRVVDLNGRAYGSLGLAQAAGIDPVALSALALLGRRPPAPPVQGRIGVRWTNLGLEVRAALDSPRPVGGALRALAASAGAAHAVWDADDRGPARVSRRRALTGLRSRVSGRPG